MKLQKTLNSTIAIAIALALTSCASSNRVKTLVAMGLAGLGAGAAGALSSPPNENPQGHALLWAGIGAAAVGAASLFVFDEEAKSTELSRENAALMKALDGLKGEGMTSDSKLIYQNDAPIGKELPKEYGKLVRPGKWSIYGLNQWVVQGENTLVHQDKMMRLLPPEFNPAVSKQEGEEKNEKQ